MSRPRLLYFLLFGLLLSPLPRLEAQQEAPAPDPIRYSRFVSALRLRAMLRPPSSGTSVRADAARVAIDAVPRVDRPAIRFTGRTIRVPIAGPVEVRAGVSWWSTGMRSAAGLSLRF